MVTVNGFFAIVCLICYAVGMFAIFLQRSRLDRIGMLSTMSTLSCCRILYRLQSRATYSIPHWIRVSERWHAGYKLYGAGQAYVPIYKLVDDYSNRWFIGGNVMVVGFHILMDLWDYHLLIRLRFDFSQSTGRKENLCNTLRYWIIW